MQSIRDSYLNKFTKIVTSLLNWAETNVCETNRELNAIVVTAQTILRSPIGSIIDFDLVIKQYMESVEPFVSRIVEGDMNWVKDVTPKLDDPTDLPIFDMIRSTYQECSVGLKEEIRTFILKLTVNGAAYQGYDDTMKIINSKAMRPYEYQSRVRM
jgi:hypothetical protein